MADTEYFGNEDRVIAGIHCATDGAFETSERAGYQGDAILACVPFNTVEAIFASAGKADGE
ncbi:MAG: hypothetical protein JWO48_2390, partial [Bryobacterales bacterium]|nr:hypothetical protein [Bryobacterales bacterium]